MQNYRSVLNPILNGVNPRVVNMSDFCAYLAWPHLFPRVPRNFLMVSKQLHLRALSKRCVVSSCLASLRFKNRGYLFNRGESKIPPIQDRVKEPSKKSTIVWNGGATLSSAAPFTTDSRCVGAAISRVFSVVSRLSARQATFLTKADNLVLFAPKDVNMRSRLT